MRLEDLLFWVKAVPFRPFRIVLNSGTSYDIRHPEMVKVGRTTVIIFEPIDDEISAFERMQMVGLVLIERIEPISKQTAA
jgi:hypothetical protein